jgi:hypothetical protein
MGGDTMLGTGGIMAAWATLGGGRGEGERGMPEHSQLTLAVVGDVKLAKLRRTMDQQVGNGGESIGRLGSDVYHVLPYISSILYIDDGTAGGEGRKV